MATLLLVLIGGKLCLHLSGTLQNIFGLSNYRFLQDASFMLILFLGAVLGFYYLSFSIKFASVNLTRLTRIMHNIRNTPLINFKGVFLVTWLFDFKGDKKNYIDFDKKKFKMKSEIF